MYKANIIFLFCYLLIFTLFPACNDEGETVPSDLLTIISTFQSAVNANDSDLLLTVISSDTNDYDVINAGTFFSDNAIFSEYNFVYLCNNSTVSSTSASVNCLVTATDSQDNTSLGIDPMTATFTFTSVSGSWLITQLKQIRTQGGDEEVILDELSDTEVRFLLLLKGYKDGKILD